MITITGKCLGVDIQEFTDKKTGEVRITKLLGIGIRKERGFEDEMYIFKIKLDKDVSVDQQKNLNSLKGKTVVAGADYSEYSMNGKNGTSFKFNGTIREVGAPGATVTKAA